MKDIEYKVVLKKLGLNWKNLLCTYDGGPNDIYQYNGLLIEKDSIRGSIPVDILNKYDRYANFSYDKNKKYVHLYIDDTEGQKDIKFNSKDDLIKFLKDIKNYYLRIDVLRKILLTKKTIDEKVNEKSLCNLEQAEVSPRLRYSLDNFDIATSPFTFPSIKIKDKMLSEISFNVTADDIEVKVTDTESKDTLKFTLYNGGYQYSLSYNDEGKKIILEHYFYNNKEKVQYKEIKGRNIKVTNYNLTDKKMSSSEKLGNNNRIYAEDYRFIKDKLDEGRKRAEIITDGYQDDNLNKEKVKTRKKIYKLGDYNE